MSKLKLLDLFSGIGGFSLGLESTGGFETIGFVEKDKFCQKVLKKHWSNINIEEDIRNVKGERYAADVITGGFPCQPFSVAGKRKSTADDRYLWDEMLRVIRETKPRWVIGENVEGIVNINEGMVLRQVLNDLENEGFKSQCIIIPASGIGAWHQRKRIWIVANSDSNRNTNEIERSNGEKEKVQREHRQEDSSTWEFIRTNSNDVSNSNSGMCSGWGAEQSSGANKEWRFCVEEKEQTEYDIRSKAVGCDALLREENSSDTNSKGLQGCSLPTTLEREQRQVITKRDIEKQQTWWKIESSLCGVPNGISYELDKGRSNRIKALGNSIVPLIAREIGLAILEAEK
jgi:DNA (cytosine-5)-methyltransferase 1